MQVETADAPGEREAKPETPACRECACTPSTIPGTLGRVERQDEGADRRVGDRRARDRRMVSRFATIFIWLGGAVFGAAALMGVLLLLGAFD